MTKTPSGATAPATEVDRARVLLVDDEPGILRGLNRQLGRAFDLTLAKSGDEALSLLEQQEFAVIVSDMRMPEMDGATLLTQVMQRWPRTERIVLTGQTDLAAAAAAVNEGNVYRFLLKPCVPQNLMRAIQEALEHQRLLDVERTLLTRTLVGSVRALTGVLALLHPSSCAAAEWCRKTLVSLLLEQDDDSIAVWELELLGLLSQLRLIAVAESVRCKLNQGEALHEQDLSQLQEATQAVDDVLVEIPRLETIRELLRLQDMDFSSAYKADGTMLSPWPSRALRILRDAAPLKSNGCSDQDIYSLISTRQGCYDRKILKLVFGHLDSNTSSDQTLQKRVKVEELVPGMYPTSDILTTLGSVLISANQPLTSATIQRLQSIHQRGGIKEPILVAQAPIDPSVT